MSKTILPVDWQTLIASPEWAAQMAAPERLFDTRAEAINPDGVILGPIAADALTVDCDGANTEQWHGVLLSSGGYPVDTGDMLHPLSGNRVRVWWQEFIPALGGWGEVPLMTGWPQDPNGTVGIGLSWSIELFDAISEAKRGGYGGQASLNVSSMTVDAALNALFGLIAPHMQASFPATDVTLPATYVLGSNEPDEDWTKIAAVAGWLVRSDRLGVITAGPAATSMDALADWQEGPGCRVETLQRSVKTSTIFNAIRVRSSSADVAPIIEATTQDDDPGSPTCVDVYGPYWKMVESDAVATQSAADNLAAVTLAANVKPIDTTKATITPRPDIDPGALINLGCERLGIAGSYRASSWSLDCPGAGAVPSLMTVTMADRAV